MHHAAILEPAVRALGICSTRACKVTLANIVLASTLLTYAASGSTRTFAASAAINMWRLLQPGFVVCHAPELQARNFGYKLPRAGAVDVAAQSLAINL